MDLEKIERQAGFFRKLVRFWFRARVEGLDHVPEGPFVAVANHSGGTLMPDLCVWLSHYYAEGKRRKPLTLMVHPLLFRAYPKWLSRWYAGIGAVSAGAANGRKALEMGNPVLICPGGDRDACRPFRDRHRLQFDGQKGYAKLARQAGVPILPVVSCGGHSTLWVLSDGRKWARRFGLEKKFGLRAFPFSLCLPWVFWWGPLPPYIPFPSRIRVRVLEPVSPSADDSATDAYVRKRMQDALNKMASIGGGT